MEKVGAWFKAVGSKIKDGFVAFGRWVKKTWILRNEPVKPLVAWAVIIGETAIAVILALIFWT